MSKIINIPLENRYFPMINKSSISRLIKTQAYREFVIQTRSSRVGRFFRHKYSPDALYFILDEAKDYYRAYSFAVERIIHMQKFNFDTWYYESKEKNKKKRVG